MKHILLTIPGIRDDGRGTTDVLGGAVADVMGWAWQRADYPVSHVWHARHENYNTLVAERIWGELPQDAYVSFLMHSYGNLLGLRMLEIAASKGLDVPVIENLILLSPAVDRARHCFEGMSFKRALVIYNPMDLAIICGSINPRHPFGAAGAFGFKTNDRRVMQEARWSMVGRWNHTKPYFNKSNIRVIRDRCLRFLERGE